MKNVDTFDERLDRHLKKCELQFRAKQIYGEVHEVAWLAPHCDTLKDIVDELRRLGFKIKRVMNEEPQPGEWMRWVETTNGVIVYMNDEYARGLVGRASR